MCSWTFCALVPVWRPYLPTGPPPDWLLWCVPQRCCSPCSLFHEPVFVVCCAHCHRDLASQSDSAFEDGIRDDVDSPDPTTELSPTRQPPSRSRARRPTKTPARCLSTLRTHTNLWHKVAGMQLALRGASSPALFRANKRGQSRSRPQRMLCKTTSLTFSANNIRRNSAFFYRLWLFFHLFASVFCLKQLFYLLHIFKCLGMYTYFNEINIDQLWNAKSSGHA